MNHLVVLPAGDVFQTDAAGIAHYKCTQRLYQARHVAVFFGLEPTEKRTACQPAAFPHKYGTSESIVQYLTAEWDCFLGVLGHLGFNRPPISGRGVSICYCAACTACGSYKCGLASSVVQGIASDAELLVSVFNLPECFILLLLAAELAGTTVVLLYSAVKAYTRVDKSIVKFISTPTEPFVVWGRVCGQWPSCL